MATDLCYYRCYPKDYLGSPIISRMTLEEQGAHQRLMAHGWRMDGIPSDRREIATLLGLEPGSERAERIITRVLDLAWKPDADHPKVLRNDEQETQRRESQAAYRKQCESVARARAKNAKNQPKELKSELKSDLKSDLKSGLQSSNPVIQKTHLQNTTFPELHSGTLPPTGLVQKPPSPPKRPPGPPAVPTPAEGAPANWVDDAVSLYAEVGILKHGVVGRALKPAVDKHGWPVVKAAWKNYIANRPYKRRDGTIWGDLPTDHPGNAPPKNTQYMSPGDFMQTFASWVPRRVA